MRNNTMRLTLLALTAALAAPALAQTTAPAQQPANEQVIVPEVQRRDVRFRLLLGRRPL